MINKLPGTKSFSYVPLNYAANFNAAYVKTSYNVSSHLKTIIKIACGIARKQASDLITSGETSREINEFIRRNFFIVYGDDDVKLSCMSALMIIVTIG